MTEEEQRIAMAELCGWKNVGPSTIEGHGPVGLHPRPDWPGDYQEVPDYLRDRNVTFDAAEQLGEATIKAMRFGLFHLCGEMKAHHATAAQETEAILRHHGKWVEETESRP